MQARDVKEFLIESLRVPRFDTRVIREIAKARRDDVATRLMVLEERRVKIVDSRMCVITLSFNPPHPFPFGPEVFCAPFTPLSRHIICPLLIPRFTHVRSALSSCPQCHKRIGHNSVIAVHAPRLVPTFLSPSDPAHIFDARVLKLRAF